MLHLRVAAILSVSLWLCTPGVVHAQGLQLNAGVSGNTVLLTWNAVAGATVYGVQAQLQGGPSVPLTPVGNVTSLQVPNVPAGTYQVQVTATNGAQAVQSNVATVVVAAAGGATPVPTNFSAAVNGNGVVFSWSLPSTAGLAGLLVEQLVGSAVTQQVPVRVSTSAAVPFVPNGTYSARIRGIGASGVSTPSNTVTFTVPSCGAPASLALSAQVSGTLVNLSWPAIPGATSYTVRASSAPGGSPDVLQQTLPASITSVSQAAPPGNYYVTVLANVGCGTAASTETLVAVATPPPGTAPRGPEITNPCPSAGSQCSPSQYPNLAQAQQIIASVSARYPGDLRNSCVEAGGNNVWLFRVVQALRQVDGRWGLMWKRRAVGDLSQDVIAYHFGPGESEGSDRMYAWDVIAGHCGSNPSWWFNNISNLNPSNALWTIQPYTRAGFTP